MALQNLIIYVAMLCYLSWASTEPHIGWGQQQQQSTTAGGWQSPAIGQWQWASQPQSAGWTTNQYATGWQQPQNTGWSSQPSSIGWQNKALTGWQNKSPTGWQQPPITTGWQQKQNTGWQVQQVPAVWQSHNQLTTGWENKAWQQPQPYTEWQKKQAAVGWHTQPTGWQQLKPYTGWQQRKQETGWHQPNYASGGDLPPPKGYSGIYIHSSKGGIYGNKYW